MTYAEHNGDAQDELFDAAREDDTEGRETQAYDEYTGNYLWADEQNLASRDDEDGEDDGDDDEPDVDDDFPMYLEYDGLYGASDFAIEQSAQDEDRYEAEAYGDY